MYYACVRHTVGHKKGELYLDESLPFNVPCFTDFTVFEETTPDTDGKKELLVKYEMQDDAPSEPGLKEVALLVEQGDQAVVASSSTAGPSPFSEKSVSDGEFMASVSKMNLQELVQSEPEEPSRTSAEGSKRISTTKGSKLFTGTFFVGVFAAMLSFAILVSVVRRIDEVENADIKEALL